MKEREEKPVLRKNEFPENFVAPTEEQLSWVDGVPLGDKMEFFKAKGPFFTSYWAWAKGYPSKMSIGTVLGRLFPDLDRRIMENIIDDTFHLQRDNEATDLERETNK